MRSIEPSLTPEIRAHIGALDVAKSPPLGIARYKDLVKHVARLAYLNQDYLLFFRGQGQDYQTRAGSSTFYPSIYRGDQLPKREVAHRFDVLDQAATELSELFRQHNVDGHKDVARKQYIQWSILQHYEVCPTPLLDFTHSLRVACSFAQSSQSGAECYVYVFGFPYLTNRISFNTEHDIVNIRLLSICPPDALRPYFQEGYLAGTLDVTSEYESKTELDFRNRLIAKFSIPSGAKFWGKGLSRVPDSELYPSGDKIRTLCQSIKPVIKAEFQAGTLGEFLSEWAEVEQVVVAYAQQSRDRLVSAGEALRVLSKEGLIDQDVAYGLDSIRKIRNKAVHEPRTVSATELRDAIEQLRRLKSTLDVGKLISSNSVVPYIGYMP